VDTTAPFTREQMDAWLREKGVSLRGGDVDESPMPYRRLPEVLGYHADTINVVHTLKPFGVVMAGTRGVRPLQGLGFRDPVRAPADHATGCSLSQSLGGRGGGDAGLARIGRRYGKGDSHPTRILKSDALVAAVALA
jgi:hypothetical protein